MKYNFDTVISREGTFCEKYDRREEIFGRPDVIPLWVADMDFAVPPFVSEAVLRRAQHPIYGYGFRSEAYHEVIVEWMQRRNGWDIRPEWLDYTPGVVAGFIFAFRAFAAEGEKVVIQPPVYPPFARMVRMNNRVVVNNPLARDTEGNFRIDFEDLDRKLEGAKVFLFCNPHNPTGRVFTREELMRIGELCLKHNVYIVSDEIHSDLIQKPYHHIPIASLAPEFAERSVTLIAPSKTFNLAGLSTSVAITPGDTCRRMFRSELAKLHIDQGNVFGTVALEAAYRYGDEWLDQLVDYIGRNMDYVVDFLTTYLPSVKTRKSEGTYLMWLDFTAWNMADEQLMSFLVEKAGIGLNEGARFGVEGRGYMRLNVATPRSILEKAMRQLRQAAVAAGLS